MKLEEKDIIRLSTKALPELKEVPDGWYWECDETGRIYFVNSASSTTTYTHPTKGPLPKPWILTIKYFGKDDAKRPEAIYFQRNDKSETISDPRLMLENLQLRDAVVSKDVLHITKITPNSQTYDPRKWARKDITRVNPRNKFERKKRIGLGVSLFCLYIYSSDEC
jgi:hypothetical protein